MDKDRGIANKIGMEVSYFKIINFYRRFEYFMLYFFDDDIFPAMQKKDVASTEMNCTDPSFAGNIEWVFRCRSYFFSVDSNMN